MNAIEMINRKETYNKVATDLSLLNDDQLSMLLNSSTSLGKSIGGTSAILKIADTNIFTKKVRLTDIEKLPENRMSTVNLFHLPLYYQYGVGSTGFGAWRELAAHILSTNWVLTGECPNFPILYHWRILPSSNNQPNEEQLMKLDKDVKYWNNSSAIYDRLKANLDASANIVLFLEYFPQNLYQWFGSQIVQGDSVMENACEMIESDLTQTISFMKSQNLIHFDAHFHNILTDGNRLYFSDFGLATSYNFELSEEERNFFKYHLDYDSYSATTNFLHCLVTHYVGKDKWVESLRELMSEKPQKFPSYFGAIIKRYAPTALLMDKFFCDLQKDKTTLYPIEELKRA